MAREEGPSAHHTADRRAKATTISCIAAIYVLFCTVCSDFCVVFFASDNVVLLFYEYYCVSSYFATSSNILVECVYPKGKILCCLLLTTH